MKRKEKKREDPHTNLPQRHRGVDGLVVAHARIAGEQAVDGGLSNGRRVRRGVEQDPVAPRGAPLAQQHARLARRLAVRVRRLKGHGQFVQPDRDLGLFFGDELAAPLVQPQTGAANLLLVVKLEERGAVVGQEQLRVLKQKPARAARATVSARGARFPTQAQPRTFSWSPTAAGRRRDAG